MQKLIMVSQTITSKKVKIKTIITINYLKTFNFFIKSNNRVNRIKLIKLILNTLIICNYLLILSTDVLTCIILRR